MKITIKPYRRKDGSIMIYLNNDRGVSLGLSPEKGFQSSKASGGQQKLWDEFCAATHNNVSVATGADMSKHSEWSFTMFNGVSFAITDVAEIGGVSVGSDGLYVVRDGRVMAARPIGSNGDAGAFAS